MKNLPFLEMKHFLEAISIPRRNQVKTLGRIGGCLGNKFSLDWLLKRHWDTWWAWSVRRKYFVEDSGAFGAALTALRTFSTGDCFGENFPGAPRNGIDFKFIESTEILFEENVWLKKYKSRTPASNFSMLTTKRTTYRVMFAEARVYIYSGRTTVWSLSSRSGRQY